MGKWVVQYQDHDWEFINNFDPVNPVVVYNKDEPSTFVCEIPLSDPALTRELIGPKRIDVRLFRDDNPIFDGEIREVNLINDRDTLLITHADYRAYLDDRIFPFEWPFDYNTYFTLNVNKWQGTDIATIAQSIVETALDYDAYSPPYEVNATATGVLTNYQIEPADETTILQHLKELGDRDDGFEVRVNRTGDHIDLILLHPSTDEFYDEEVAYTITPDVGQITTFNWTNKGPDNTWFMGLGSGFPNKSNAAFHTHLASQIKFRRRDRVMDFGQIRNANHLQKMTNAESIRGLFPQKELELSVVVDVKYLPNFWSLNHNRPESLLGRRIWVGPIKFYDYWTVNAAFKILDMTIDPDEDGNEFCTFGLEMIDG